MRGAHTLPETAEWRTLRRPRAGNEATRAMNEMTAPADTTIRAQMEAIARDARAAAAALATATSEAKTAALRRGGGQHSRAG